MNELQTLFGDCKNSVFVAVLQDVKEIYMSESQYKSSLMRYGTACALPNRVAHPNIKHYKNAEALRKKNQSYKREAGQLQQSLLRSACARTTESQETAFDSNTTEFHASEFKVELFGTELFSISRRAQEGNSTEQRGRSLQELIKEEEQLHACEQRQCIEAGLTLDQQIGSSEDKQEWPDSPKTVTDAPNRLGQYVNCLA